MARETDKENSPLNEDFRVNLTKVLERYLAHEFSPPKSIGERKMDLTAFGKLCQSLAVEVTEYEANRLTSKRIRRAVANV
jgi:hypothetical protein